MHLGARSREPAASRTALASACIVTAVCVMTVVGTARFPPDATGAPERRFPAPVAILALLAIALVITAVWTLRRPRPRSSTGLSIAAVATLVPLWSAWSWLGAGLRAATLALSPFAIIGILVLIAGWHGSARGGTVSRRAGVLLAVGAGLIHLLGYDPFGDLGCARTCERVTLPLAGVLSTQPVVALVSTLTVAAAIAVVAGMFRGRDRPVPALVVGAAVAAIGCLAAGSALRWATWGDTATWSLVLVLQPCFVAIVAATVCLVEGRSWRTRAAVDRIVAGLSAQEGTSLMLGGGIRDAHFAVPGTHRWVDVAGNDVGAPNERSKHLVLTHDRAPIIRLVLSRSADEGDVLATLTPASRLALRNAQLSAVALARLAEVRASQRRVVAATDAERRRIERDLHDGAQQRLIGVSFQLSIARARVDAAPAAMLERVGERVRDALGRLRELAHGMFPRVLADEGLEAALEDLVSASPVPASLSVRLEDSVDPEIAVAAYATVAGVLRHPSLTPRGRSAVRVSLERIDDDLVVRTEMDGEDVTLPDVTEVADRVGAVGGQLSVSRGPGGVAVKAVIPCGS